MGVLGYTALPWLVAGYVAFRWAARRAYRETDTSRAIEPVGRRWADVAYLFGLSMGASLIIGIIWFALAIYLTTLFVTVICLAVAVTVGLLIAWGLENSKSNPQAWQTVSSTVLAQAVLTPLASLDSDFQRVFLRLPYRQRQLAAALVALMVWYVLAPYAVWLVYSNGGAPPRGDAAFGLLIGFFLVSAGMSIALTRAKLASLGAAAIGFAGFLVLSEIMERLLGMDEARTLGEWLRIWFPALLPALAIQGWPIGQMRQGGPSNQ
jgi:hypothetical protein